MSSVKCLCTTGDGSQCKNDAAELNAKTLCHRHADLGESETSRVCEVSECTNYIATRAKTTVCWQHQQVILKQSASTHKETGTGKDNGPNLRFEKPNDSLPLRDGLKEDLVPKQLLNNERAFAAQQSWHLYNLANGIENVYGQSEGMLKEQEEKHNQMRDPDVVSDFDSFMSSLGLDRITLPFPTKGV